MRKIFLLLASMFLLFYVYGNIGIQSGFSTKQDQHTAQAAAVSNKQQGLQVQVQGNGYTVIYALNDSVAARELYSQLPLTIKVENYSNNEKIFYPPRKLSTNNTPIAIPDKGSLAYFAPWGNVVMFYEDFSRSSSLYGLGQAVSGINDIEKLSGLIELSAVE